MFKLRKTRQKLALSLTPLGAVRAAAERTEYKNRRLGKPVVYASTRDWSSRYGAIRSEPETAVFLLALLSVSRNTHAVSLLHAS